MRERRFMPLQGTAFFRVDGADGTVHLKRENGDTVLILEADTDNDTEADTPYIEFRADGGAKVALIGMTGVNDELPDGETKFGPDANDLVLWSTAGIAIVCDDGDNINIRAESGIIFGGSGDEASNVVIDPAASNVELRDGFALQIQDSGDTDWATLSHDGTDFITEFTNTTSWRIAGEVPVSIDPGVAGYTAISRTMAGLELSADGMNATNEYTAAIKFMSRDGNFTTENPKLIGWIAAEARETYSSDTDGGAAITFGCTPNNPGATNVPVVKMKIINNGLYIHEEDEQNDWIRIDHDGTDGIIDTNNAGYLLFMDGEATATTSGGYLPNSQIKWKSVDEQAQSDTTLSDDGELAGFVLKADTMYLFEGFVQCDATGNTPDIKWDFQFSQSPQDSAYSWIAYDSGGNFISADLATMTTQETLALGTADRGVIMRGFFMTNVSAGGTLDWQWAQNTSSAEITNVHRGSWMRITKLGTV